MTNLIVVAILVAVGLLAHWQSLSLALYGDDWLVIYLYFMPDGAPSRFGPLPGILTHLTPYGPSIFLMGKLYEIFGTTDYLYFSVAFIFRVFASWGLFLTLFQITKSKMVSILVAILFLVGFTGIQTTDWVFYMNVYLAAAFFFLSIYFQFRFSETFRKKDMINQLIFFILAVITAPVRLTPFVLISPLIEIIIFFNKRNKISKIIIIKIFLLIGIILFLWLIGVFGGPRKIHSAQYWSLTTIFKLVFNDIMLSASSFLHWIGVIILPDYLNFRIFDQKLTGSLFLIFYAVGFILNRKDKERFAQLLIGGLISFIFLTSMWLFSKFRLTTSEDRYLFLPFAGFCILLGILSASFIKHYKKSYVMFLLIALIVTNLMATRSIYKNWLYYGRDQKFIQAVHGQIIDNIALPLTKNDIIYLDFDDMAKNQSVVFGLGYKILLLTNTLDDKLHPNIYDNNTKDSKSVIIKKLQEKISQGLDKEELIQRVFAFELKEGIFKNVSADFRKELSTLKQ